MKQQKTLRLVETGLLLAVAGVLSMVKVLDLPYGGSITAFSALPILLVGYRHGTGWGLFTGFAYALIQLFLSMSTLSYATSAGAAVAILTLDYLLAFTVLGLGGIFRRRIPSQGGALVAGAVFTGGCRYILHVIAGCTVWAGLSIPTEAALVYSLAYNATYMIPETLVTALGAHYLSRAVDLREQTPSRAKTITGNKAAAALSMARAACLLTAGVWDIAELFRPLQDPETGNLVLTNLSRCNWTLMSLVTAVAVAAWLVLTLIRRRITKTAS